MVVLNKTQSMFECKVLYIGSAPPTETLSGTDALQEPIRNRYPENLKDVNGIETILRVQSDCLEMFQIVTGNVIQFPLDRLKICAAVRAVNAVDETTGDVCRQFVPLNTLQPETSQPAIFSAIIRKKQGREIAECHVFICSSPRDALHLVNTTAAANLNIKALRGQSMSESVKYRNGVPVIHDVRDNHHATMNGGEVRHMVGGNSQEQYTMGGISQEQYTMGGISQEQYTMGGISQEHMGGTSQEQHFDGGIGNEQYDNNTIYIKSSIIRENVQHDMPQEPVQHYLESNYHAPQQRQEVVAHQPSTIYVKFDKSNLITKGDDHLELQPSTEQYSTSLSRSIVMQAPPRIMQAPPPIRAPMPMMYRRPMPPRPVFVRPPPQPFVMARPPPPQQMVFQRHMHPAVLVPPRQRTIMSAPPQGRMYARRIVAPPPRIAAQPPVYYKTRARSSSPDFNRSEIRSRATTKSKYQPKWRSHSSDILEYRKGRQDAPMHMNERAFSRRMNTDQRFSQYPTAGHNYPTAYDFNDVMMYDRPISKSNPRYSSSSSGDEGDLRFSGNKRRH